MFRDASEELARIEAELLAEEEPEATEDYDEEYEDDSDGNYDGVYEEDDSDDREDPWLYEDTAPAKDSVIYQNYSNDYGKNLRNYASGYHAYNSDTADEDLEEYSQQVYEGRKSGRGGTLAVILILILLLAGVLVFLAWKKGYLG